MRIISPIKVMEAVTTEEVLNCMEANFHSVLDVRYAISDAILWAAFIHPLRELSNQQIEDAVRQVHEAVITFGTTYSSTDFRFPKLDEEPTDPPKKKIKKL